MTQENLEKAEQALMACSGLQPNEYEIRKVIVDKELNHHMTTIIVNTKRISGLSYIRLSKSVNEKSNSKPKPLSE